MSFLKTNSASRLSFYAFLFISITFVFVKFRQVNSIEPFIRDSYALSWDNYGYYLHLPATIIHHDIGIENRSWIDSLNNKYQSGRPFYQVSAGQKNRLVNVYPVGLAICNLPFFLAGHTYANIFGYSADGLSPPYQWAMIFSALFFGILGMWWLRKLLLQFFSDRLSTLLLILIGLGTNLYYYATYNNIMPHIFLFAIDTQILLLTISWHKDPKVKTAFALGTLIGLITIIRPSEIVWLLIPLFWNVSSFKALIAKFKLLRQYSTHVILLIVGMIIIGSLQLFYWKYTSGNWFSFNHSEGFDFFHPFTIDVLFSYKKGWLLYTPLMILSIIGVFFLYKKKKSIFLPTLLFFLANLWFISSWECWWYAGSFGQRPFVQSYGLMAIPLGYFLSAIGSGFSTRAAVSGLSASEAVSGFQTRHICISIVLLFVLLLNQFQTWQIDKGIIHPELMTKDYYWKVFGKTKVQPEWNSLLEIDRGNLPSVYDNLKKYNVKEVLNIDFEKNEPTIPQGFVCDTLGASGTHCFKLNSANPYGAPFKKPFSELTTKDHVWFNLNMHIYLPKDLNSSTLNLVLSMTGARGQSYGYTSQSFRIVRTEDGPWAWASATLITPYILHKNDLVTVNIWNSKGEEVFIDDVTLTMYVPK